MFLDIQTHVFGPYGNNTYTLTDAAQKIAILVDAPSGSFEGLKDILKDYKIHLFLTHGHWDHMCEAAQFQRLLNATVYAHKGDSEWYLTTEQGRWTPPGVRFEPVTPNVWVEPNASLQINELPIQILHTPGHTPGKIALYMPSFKAVFVGDTIFYKTVGRTDLPKGNLQQLIHSIQSVLYALPEDTQVYPGHGKSTTIGFEKRRTQVKNTTKSL